MAFGVGEAGWDFEGVYGQGWEVVDVLKYVVRKTRMRVGSAFDLDVLEGFLEGVEKARHVAGCGSKDVCCHKGIMMASTKIGVIVGYQM